MFCGNCGKEVKPGAAFCTHCGVKKGAVMTAVPEQQMPPQEEPAPSIGQPGMHAQSGSAPKSVNPWQHFCNVLKKYAVFKGRARRAEFWFFALFYTIFYFIYYSMLALIFFVISLFENDDELVLIGENETVLIVLGLLGLFYLAMLLPGLAVWVRRIHDTGKSGWFILVPIYGFILCFMKGTPGPNRFGPDGKYII